jgi:hypothetical protein
MDLDNLIRHLKLDRDDLVAESVIAARFLSEKRYSLSPAKI